jgi:sulfite reductase alpha subunit-like flavoprotein
MSDPRATSILSGSSGALAGAAFIATALVLRLFQISAANNATECNASESHRLLAVESTEDISGREKVHILYGTTTGTSRNFANTLARHIEKKCHLSVAVTDLKDYTEEKLNKENIVLFICSTWTDGKAPESCNIFFDWLLDQAFDFRVSKDTLANLRFAVFGLGGELYAENFCKAVRLNLVLQMKVRCVTFLPSSNRPRIWMNNWSDWEVRA